MTERRHLMSYRCNNCLYIFPNKMGTCPFCGRRIFKNDISDSELIKDGFMQAPNSVVNNTDNISNSVDFTISKRANQSSNIFEDLQASYDKEHRSNKPKNEAADNIPLYSETSHSTKKIVKENPSSSEGGFFAQFNSPSEPFVPEVEIPTERQIATDSSSTPTSPYYDESYENEMRLLEEQQRRIQREYNRLARRNFLSSVRWRTIFRFLSILGIIILLIVIWNMRFVIIESITNFLVSLIPIVIAIGIIWYLIKSFFSK